MPSFESTQLWQMRGPKLTQIIHITIALYCITLIFYIRSYFPWKWQHPHHRGRRGLHKGNCWCPPQIIPWPTSTTMMTLSTSPPTISSSSNNTIRRKLILLHPNYSTRSFPQCCKSSQAKPCEGSLQRLGPRPPRKGSYGCCSRLHAKSQGAPVEFGW